MYSVYDIGQSPYVRHFIRELLLYVSPQDFRDEPEVLAI